MVIRYQNPAYNKIYFGDASRLLHALHVAEVLPDPAARKVRPVLYNSWEATFFAVWPK